MASDVTDVQQHSSVANDVTDVQ